MTILDLHGLQIASQQSNSPVAYCALSIRSGTRDEGSLSGLAHFTEHLLFKGTTQRNASSINNRLERLGGELNAYTTKEDTVLHATVLKEDLPKAIDLLVEMAFSSTFPEKEVEKERVVILDEINSYKDAPAEQIFDDFEETLFAGTSLATPVLGYAKSLKKIRREHIVEYVQRSFLPKKMSLTVMADYPEERIASWIRRSLERHRHLTGDFPKTESLPPVTQAAKPFLKEIKRKGYQTHCLIGGPAYSAFDPRRNALVLLINLLGGPAANSRLNTLLREKNALVYSVDASYNTYRDTGCFCIYFGCDHDHYDRCSQLVHRELEHLCNHKLSDASLRAAKKQFLGQWAISSDNGESQVLAMGKSLLTHGKIRSREEIRSLIENISSNELLSVAQDLFDQQNISQLTYL